jgi:nitrile hydratase
MTRNIQIPGHTRLPRYAREKLGTVIAVRGRHVFPDAVVNEGVEDPQWLYTIEFQGAELWGDSVDPTIFNLIDAFEPYLERP